MALRALQGPAGGSAPVGGSGTTNTIPRWTGPSTLGDSLITQSGSFTGVNCGAGLPTQPLHVVGNILATLNSVSGQSIQLAPGNSYGTLSSGSGLILSAAAGTLIDGTFHQFRSAGGASTRMVIDTSGNVGIGTASPGALLDASSGKTVGTGGFRVGADVSATTRTNNTRKIGSLSVPHYDNSASDASLMAMDANTTTNTLYIGGGWAQNAATSILFYTGATSTTTTGTERARIDSSGRLLVGTSTAPSSPSVKSVIASSGGVYAGIQNTGANVGCAFGVSANFEIYTTSGAYGSEAYTQRMAISSSGAASASQVAIGTSSFTTGRALTTVADLDVFGVRVGRGPGDIASNTAVGAGALSFCTTGSENTALGQNAGFGISTGVRNVMIGAATGSGGTVTGSRNIVIGRQAGNQLTSGSDNVLLGTQAGDSITTGSSNIVIGCGASADVAAATDSNQLVLGDATNYVATNGGATTYYATAGASLGYMRVRLNGTYVKIEVFADV